ncbi:MAG: OsmC family protein [Idiomarina sp.]
MKRNASAQWKGGLKDGKGTISTDSGVLENTQYSFGTRFENGKGTNPEELIASAHAGCFSMALAMLLGEADVTPDSVDTKASVSLEEDDSGFSITKIHLDVKVKASGIDNDEFQKIAGKAKDGCPVSKVLRADISMSASLN